MRSQGTHFHIGLVPLLLALLIPFLGGAGVGAAMSIHRENRKHAAKPVHVKKPQKGASSAGIAKRSMPRPNMKPAAKTRHARPAAPAKRTSPLAGKGMWIYELNKVGRGDPNLIAQAAKDKGITHIYVRVGSGASGLNTAPQAAGLIHPAHRRGIKVIAWYFPYFKDIRADVARSLRIIRHTSHGEGFDGFAADIEPAPGSRFNRPRGYAYSVALRRAAPGKYLVLVPPRVTAATRKTFPYWALVPHYNAVAPMVYWGRFDPAQSVTESMRFLSRYGKDIAPIGQAYNMAPEGGPLGNPGAAATIAFMTTAKQLGATGVSFWSWQHASIEQLHTIHTYRW